MTTLNEAWWALDSADIGEAVWCVTERLRNEVLRPLERRCADLLTLYQGGVLQEGMSPGLLQMLELDQALSYNVCQSCSDTMIASLVANRVNPLFVTEAGSYEERQRAQGMQRAVEGLFHEAGVWGPRGEDTCSDGIVWGLGATYVWADVESMRPVYERVLPWEVLVHPQDARRGDPRSIGLLRRPDRAQLRAAFETDAFAQAAIDAARPVSRNELLSLDVSGDRIADRVEVAVWWHLPSVRVDRDDPASWGRDADGEAITRDKVPHDGRCVIVCDGRVLSDTPYPYEYAPIAFFRPKRHRLGFRGRGIPEQLVGVQLEITRLMTRISNIIQLYAMPLIYLWSNAGVNVRKVASNEIGRVIQGRAPAGQAIQYITPQAVPGELWLQLDRLIDYAYRLTGISELTSQARKPDGVQYAVGMQMLADNESLRHMPTYRAWEQYHVDLARISVDVLRTLATEAEDRGLDFGVIWHSDRDLKRIDWSETDLGEMAYRLRASPTNLLPTTPAAKLDRVLYMYESQLIDRDTAISLLPFPDVAAGFAVEQAALRDANARIDAALEGNVTRSIPSAYSDLALLVRHGIKRYQALSADGARETELDRLRALIAMADTMLQQQAQAAAPPQPMGGDGGSAEVGAPPVQTGEVM